MYIELEKSSKSLNLRSLVNVKPQRERWENSGQDLIKERGQSLEFEFSQQGPSQHSCLENPMDWRSLVGCSPWGREESDTTERHFHFSLSCIGEGNGNPLQCSCLENPRDRGAWWAAVYGVAQSRTRLK